MEKRALPACHAKTPYTRCLVLAYSWYMLLLYCRWGMNQHSSALNNHGKIGTDSKHGCAHRDLLPVPTVPSPALQLSIGHLGLDFGVVAHNFLCRKSATYPVDPSR